MSRLKINDTEVRISDNGLYSLNDLFKASGADRKKSPPFFLRSARVKAFIEELSKGTKTSLLEKTTGRNGGTWVSSDLVYKYAAWISPSFDVRVIQTFKAVVDGDAHKAVAIASNDEKLMKIISKRDSILSGKLSAGKKADRLCLLEDEWINLMSGAGKTLAIGRGQPMLFKKAEEQVLSEIQDKFEF